MYNRTLKRPMFRIGGSAGTGITTGLDKPKRGLVNEPGKYSQSDSDESVDSSKAYFTPTNTGEENFKSYPSDFLTLKSLVGERPTPEKYPYAGSDFFMGLGSNILAQPGGQPIFQTIGKASQGPIAQLGKTNMANWQMDEKGKLGEWQSDKELLLTAYKNMSEENKNKLYAEATARFNNKAMNPRTGAPYKSISEAYNDLVRKDLMSKEKVLTPEAQYNDSYDKFLSKHLSNPQFKGNSVAASNLSKHEANIVHEKYPLEVIEQFNLTQLYIDPVYYDEKNGVKTLNEIGDVIPGLETGKIYMNVADGKMYKLGPNKIFEEVSLTDLQE
jgi:hypothetical protein